MKLRREAIDAAKIRLGAFSAPFHPLAENPTLALERNLGLVVHMDKLGYDEAWIGEAQPAVGARVAERIPHNGMGNIRPEILAAMVLDKKTEAAK
jgi:hypothetical protein